MALVNASDFGLQLLSKDSTEIFKWFSQPPNFLMGSQIFTGFESLFSFVFVLGPKLFFPQKYSIRFYAMKSLVVIHMKVMNSSSLKCKPIEINLSHLCFLEMDNTT